MVTVTFVKKPVVEFARWALFRYFEKFVDINSLLNFSKDPQLIEYVDILDNSLTSFLKKEIEFFNSTNSLEVIFWGFIHDYDIYTIDDLFKVFDESSIEILFQYIGGSFLSQKLIDDNSDFDAVKHDLNLMKDYIKNLSELSLEDKELIIDLYSSPEETKMRLRYILSKLSDIYKAFEPSILSILEKEEQIYIDLYSSDKEKFFYSNFLDRFGIDFSSDLNITFCISYFSLVGAMIDDLSSPTPCAYVGYKNIEAFEYTTIENNLEKFLKLLGDKTRQKILFLLSERPYYTHELAKKLNLTASTINHHLQIFLAIDIAYFKEENNKCYYYLDKKNIKLFLNLLNNKLSLD
ncbi:MAG: ArsR/SmtB family transcription factor [Clostridium sp.]|uniref:ArsR/SmtB family transcription factor n=1 Tax=Clostridium sp. TaxID=1506 RepID=UPI003EE4A522